MAMNFFNRLMPNNNAVFFSLFNDAATTALEMANLLHQTVEANNMQDEKMAFNNISRLKDKGSNLKRQMYSVSGQAFISPFSRDDMYALSSALNSVSDYIDICARRLNFYNIIVNAPIKQLTQLIVDCCEQLVLVVEALADITQQEVITGYSDKIKQMEHFADQAYTKAMAALIEKETNPLEVMKYTEIFAVLEKATDKCENVVNVIESIVVKNS